MHNRRHYQTNDRNIIPALIVLFLIFAGVIGWFMNIYKLATECDFDTSTSFRCEVVRGVGVPIAIVGAITGWMDFEEK